MRFAERHVSVPVVTLVLLLLAPQAEAQCPEEPPLPNFSGPGAVVCPCFAVNEEAGATFDVPAEMLPIEILRVGIGWGSQFGGNPPQLEDAIKIYEGGLPDPGAPARSSSTPRRSP